MGAPMIKTIGSSTIVIARDLDEAHFLSLSSLLSYSEITTHSYLVKRGSFENEQSRLEFNNYLLEVVNPETRPLVPQMPAGVPAPSEMDYVEEYYKNKILSNAIEDNETYTYGAFIEPNIERIAAMLAETPDTNHAYIRIGGQLEIIGKGMVDVDVEKDPPCLRLIQWRAINGKLDIHVTFRSWDLWGGFPSNLAALQLLNEHMAEMTGYKTGRLYAHSAGLHLYGLAIDIAKQRLGI
jgi:thymidylate synthase